MHILYAAILVIGLAFSTVVNADAQTRTLSIPEPLRVEHHELFEALEAATRAGGATAEAAKKVMAVLKPHFDKEERFALPQLGALEMLTRQGATISPDMKKDLIARTERFRTELPAMLQEHKQISASLVEMQKAAKFENKLAIAALAEKIMGHAGMEEKILYPAVLLIGEYARSR